MKDDKVQSSSPAHLVSLLMVGSVGPFVLVFVTPFGLLFIGPAFGMITLAMSFFALRRGTCGRPLLFAASVIVSVLNLAALCIAVQVWREFLND